MWLSAKNPEVVSNTVRVNECQIRHKFKEMRIGVGYYKGLRKLEVKLIRIFILFISDEPI